MYAANAAKQGEGEQHCGAAAGTGAPS